MKKILLLLLICSSTAAIAQKKVTSLTRHMYTDASALEYVDSNAYTYATWQGSITENEPKFGLEENGLAVTWHWNDPEINYTSSENWSNSSYPLNLSFTSTKSYDAFYRCIEEETSMNNRTLFTYTASGKIETETYELYNTSWETNYVRTNEYDGQDRLVQRKFDDYSTGSAIQVQRDTLEYQGTTNNIIRGISYESTNGVDFDPIAELTYTWASGNPATLEYYIDHDSDPGTPMLWQFHGEYNYTGNTLDNLQLFLVDNGSPSTLFGEFTYSYNADDQLTIETATGFSESITTYTYDPEGFVSEIERQRDEGTGMHVAQVDRFYYQNTASIDENAIELSVFPVPANDVLTIQSNSAIKGISVYSMNGNKLIDQTGSLNTVDVSTLSSGSYILHVATEQGVSSTQFVK